MAEGRVLARIDRSGAPGPSSEVRRPAYDVAEAALQRSQQLRERQFHHTSGYERDQGGLEAARASRDQLLTRVGFAECPLSHTGGSITR